MCILTRTIPRWRFLAVLAGLLTVMATNVASAHDGPGQRIRRSHYGAIAHQHGRYAPRGHTAGQRAGFRAGYDAGRSGCGYDPSFTRHGRHGARRPHRYRNGYARGYADAYARGYRRGSSENRRWRRCSRCR